MKCLKQLAGAAFGAVLWMALSPLPAVAQSLTSDSKTNSSPNSTSAGESLSAAQMQRWHDIEAQLKAQEDEIEAKAQQVAANASILAATIQEKIAETFSQQGRSISRPGWLGIGIEEVTPERAKSLNLAATRGVLIEQVDPESPAAKAGLRDNDVITRYGDQVVEGVVQFRRLVRETPPGRIVALGIWRDGKAATVSIEVGTFRAPGEWPISAPAFPGSRFFDLNTAPMGLDVEGLTSQLGAYFGAPENQGVLVREVRRASAAEKAGVKAGDVIIKENGQPVRAVSDLQSGERVELTLLRRGATVNVTITLPNQQPVSTL